MKLRTPIVIAMTTLFLTGCMSTSQPQRELTPEERAQAEEARAAFIARMRQAVSSNQQTAPAQVAEARKPDPIKVKEKEEILNAMAAISASGSPATFSVQRDGLLINDEMYLDPEGTIESSGWDTITGNFTYTIRDLDGNLQLKYFSAGSNQQPLVLGTIYRNSRGYLVETVTGEKLQGETLVPTSKGALVVRSASAFLYEAGQQVKSIAIPAGWNVAKLQRGDVDSTGMILLEKTEEAKSNDGVSGLLSSFSSLTKSVGLTESEDYAIFNLHTKNGFVLNMDKNDKEVTRMSNCERQNDFVNKCHSANSYESLYETNGRKNRLHYFWAADWFDTPIGPLLAYNTGTRINVLDISGQKEITLFQRTMGVNEFDIERKQGGVVALVVKLGFDTQYVEDLVMHIANSAQLDVKEAKTL